MTFRSQVLTGVLVVALACAATFAAPVDAQVNDRLRDGLFKRREAPDAPLARYVTEGGKVFVLDRTQPAPLLKFDDSPEVWVLLPSPAPRGDTIYKNDLGEPVLRATRLGGYTLFTDDRPQGQAVSLAGGSQPLRLLPISPQALADRLLQASFRSSRAARHPIAFQAEASPASSALMGDAAVLVTVALYQLAEKSRGREPIAPFNLVLFEEGKKASATLKAGVLRIVVAPRDGVAGRPSSKRIMRAASGK